MPSEEMRDIASREIPDFDDPVRRTGSEQGVVGRDAADEDDSRVCFWKLAGIAKGERFVRNGSGQGIEAECLGLVRRD